MPRRTVKVFQVDVFTQQLFAGNPAGVVLGSESLTETEMQALARELNNSDSAFVLPADGNDHDVNLRFFTPTREVAFVGHASVAAHAARLAAGTASAPRVTVAFPPPQFQAPIDGATRSRLLDIFGIETSGLDSRCPILVTKRTTTRLLIGLRSAELLGALQPNMEDLKRITPHIGADGFFLFVRDAHGPGTTESRLFSPVLGIPEDPVSGNAHGMLGAYLVAHGLLPLKNGRGTRRGFQGRSLGRPGEVEVEIETSGGQPSLIRMMGSARIVFTTEIALD